MIYTGPKPEEPKAEAVEEEDKVPDLVPIVKENPSPQKEAEINVDIDSEDSFW